MLPSSGTCRRILAVLLLMSLVACGAGIDPEDYDRIEAGMSSARVRSLLGKPTRGGGFDYSDSLGLSSGTWIWEKDRRTVIVTFKDDQVLTKRKRGF